MMFCLFSQASIHVLQTVRNTTMKKAIIFITKKDE